MPVIIVKTPFKFSEDGLHVILIDEGEQEVSERCALVAVEQLEVAELVAGKEQKQEKKEKKSKANNADNKDDADQADKS